MLLKFLISLPVLLVGIGMIIAGLLLKRRADRMVHDPELMATTVGTVTGVSSYYVADDYHLLDVTYEVEGREYKVAGPSFLSAKSHSSRSALPGGEAGWSMTANTDGCTSAADLPLDLDFRVESRRAMPPFRHYTPLLAQFPVGTKVPVWYNPERPKEAQAFRWCPVGKGFPMGALFMGIGAGLLAITALLLLLA